MFTSCTSNKTIGAGEVLSSTYKWEIDNYSSYSDLETGKCVWSPEFNLNNSSWYLQMYPNGEDKTVSQAISLFLYIETQQVETRAQFAFTCFDTQKKVIASYVSRADLLFINQKGWGRKHFVDKSVMANSANINKSNKITILCEVIVKEAKLYKKILMISPDRLQHFEELKNQLDNPKFSDVKFTVQKKEISAHKMVLAANSSVFAAMFAHKMRENEENIVKIEDISYKVFNTLLNFVYSGECTLSEDIVSELFEAADKYQLLKLKDMCEEELCKNLSADNAIAFLQFADMHSAERLKKMAIDFIVLNGKEMIDRPEFDLLKSLHLDLFKDVFREIFTRIN